MHTKGSRLDIFFKERLGSCNDYTLIWRNIITVLLTLSHGLASVEKGFSICKSLIWKKDELEFKDDE